MIPSKDELTAERCRRSLRHFVNEAWPIVEPGRAYKSNWHIDAICEHLEAVTRGEIRRLLINIPPRHMKSLTVGVFWPAWDWLTHPERRYLYGSYAERLTKRDSLKCRWVIESKGLRSVDDPTSHTLLERVGYRGLLNLIGDDWGLSADQNEKLRFENERRGFRLASTIEGMGTGEGGDVLVADDPHKVQEAESEIQRGNVLDWWFGTMSTRLNDPQTGSRVVVMQRIHEADLAGAIIERGGYEHLCLPARYEPKHPYVWPKDPRTKTGDLLWPEHIPDATLREIEIDLAPLRAAGQLQQRPSPAEGAVFKADWFQRYRPEHSNPSRPETHGYQAHRALISVDCAFKANEDSDYVVIQAWVGDQANRYLDGEIRAQLSFVETCAAFEAMCDWVEERHPHLATVKLVEDAANGAAVLNVFRNLRQGLVPFTPKESKEARAHAESAQVAGSNVWIPEGNIPCPPAPTHDKDDQPYRGGEPLWRPTPGEALIAECCVFPNGANDDQVDAMTQALKYMRQGGGGKVRVGGSGARDRSG